MRPCTAPWNDDGVCLQPSPPPAGGVRDGGLRGGLRGQQEPQVTASGTDRDWHEGAQRILVLPIQKPFGLSSVTHSSIHYYLSLLICSFPERTGYPSAAFCSLFVEASESIALRGESKAVVRHLCLWRERL